MKCKVVLFMTVCLSFWLAPAAGASLVISGHAGLGSAGGTVVVSKPGHVVQTIPAHQPVVVEHKPSQVTLVPLATIPSYSLTDRLARLWGGISDSIGGKIRAVGDFFRPPPHVMVVNMETPTTHKPTTTKKPCHQPVLVEVIAGVPQYRYVSVLEDCDKSY